MSAAAVATIACLALVAALGAAAWLFVQHRRIEALRRSLTSRKWDIVTLRAELGALRRQTAGEPGGDPVLPCPQSSQRVGVDGPGAGGEPEAGTSEGRSRLPPSPTAWRRDRARAASTRPRRRRPS